MTTSTPPLPKFYIQSGPSQWVLLAPDVDAAAIRFAHCVLRSCVRNQRRASDTAPLIDQDAYESLLNRFGHTVNVSESGFDGDQIGIFATPEVLQRWQQQMLDLEKTMGDHEG